MDSNSRVTARIFAQLPLDFAYLGIIDRVAFFSHDPIDFDRMKSWQEDVLSMEEETVFSEKILGCRIRKF